MIIPTALAVGARRGLVELRQSLSPGALAGHLLWPVVTLVAIVLLGRRSVPGGPDLGALALPSALGMFVAFGLLLVIQYLTADRDDGTLLRAKATPHGISVYVVGRMITVSVTILGYLVMLLVPGLFIVEGIDLARPGAWFTLTWVLLLGFIATQSVGVVLGVLVRTPRGTGYVSVLVLGLVAISGVFYPIAALPSWVQGVGQVFPMYWLGLGMRSALLPESAAIVEIGQSWRHPETAAVLGTWAAVGLIAAPLVLARMTRRESGSRLAERREQALQRLD